MGAHITPKRLSAAQDAIGHRFADPGLLARALTHPSRGGESAASSPDYERLEFLGDAVLGLVIADEIYHRFPGLAEGSMTKLKATIVSHGALVAAARSLGLDAHILLGRAHADDAGRALPSALEDAFEAIVGALYLDAGLESARKFVLHALGEHITPESFDALAIEHPKSRLQEIAQATGLVPVYTTIDTAGPPHARRFTVEVTLGGRLLGTGVGGSKREAEMHAAAAALGILDSES